MVTQEQAHIFANDWIASWINHDLDQVMSHYDDNIEYYSIFLLKLTDNKTGVLQGKENVRNYLSKGLEAYPNLHFKLINILLGVASVTIYYQSVNNLMAAEVFEINKRGLVSRVQCHYHSITE